MRRCSASSATVIGPARECSFDALSMKSSSISGRAGLGLHVASRLQRQARPRSANPPCGRACPPGPRPSRRRRRTRWRRAPSTAASPLSITPRYRFIAPNRLVWNPSSIGGSNDDGRGRVDRDVDVARSCGTPREKSPSTIVTRSSRIARSPSSPKRSRNTSNAGLRKRYSTRSRDVEPVCERTKQDDPALGDLTEQSFEDDLPQEPRHPGQQDRTCPSGDRRSRGRSAARRSLPCGRLCGIYQLVDKCCRVKEVAGAPDVSREKPEDGSIDASLQGPGDHGDPGRGARRGHVRAARRKP